jgi:hypothetical protein
MADQAAVELAAEETMEKMLASMAVLRDFDVPAHDALPDQVHAALIALRGRLDAAETLLQLAARERRQARRIARRLTEAADDIYDAELSRRSERAVTREFESIQDRTVGARMKALEARRKARRAAAVTDLVEEAEDALKSSFFGLRDIRKELLTTLDSFLPWLASMET